MSGINNRRHERVKHRAKVRVMTHPKESYILEMHEFSDSGLYVSSDDLSIVKLGDKVEIQTLELEDAPILPANVVRMDKLGFAVEFDFD